jgi:hypothetical protein
MSRADKSAPETVIGRDGKEYPATRVTLEPDITDSGGEYSPPERTGQDGKQYPATRVTPEPDIADPEPEEDFDPDNRRTAFMLRASAAPSIAISQTM